MKRIKIVFIALLALICVAPAGAQEKRKWFDYVRPSGSLQGGVSFDPQSMDYQFYVRRARIAVLGTVLDNPRYGKLEYVLRTSLVQSPSLLDGFIKYTLRDEFGVQFGQFRSPVNLENTELSSTTIELIDYSLVTQRFCHLGSLDLEGINASGRDIGINFYGKFLKMSDGHHLIRYDVGVFNGAGINRRDDDHRKHYMARLMVYPLKDLSVVAYYSRVLGPHPDVAPEYNVYDWYVYDRYGGGLYYKSKYGWFRGEYMEGHTHGYLARGAYATLGYFILPQLDVSGRYDYFVTNTARPDISTQHLITAGFRWKPFSFFFAQLNYSYNIAPGGATPTHSLNLQTSLVF